MRFEHLVEVNDPDNPLAFTLEREHLWAGLMARVEDSVPFLPGMVECRILSREAGAVERLLVFGAAEVRDRASYVEAEWVCFETRRTAQHAGGSLTIRIEEPEAGRLFLRFTSETSFAEPGDDPEASRPFRRAGGDVEFQTDGTCVNTTGGWREVRLSIFAKRTRGKPVRSAAQGLFQGNWSWPAPPTRLKA